MTAQQQAVSPSPARPSATPRGAEDCRQRSSDARNLHDSPAGAERLSVPLGDLESARDIRFLVEHGADLGRHGATLRTWAAGRGALQVLDIGLVAESLTPKGIPS